MAVIILNSSITAKIVQSLNKKLILKKPYKCLLFDQGDTTSL